MAYRSYRSGIKAVLLTFTIEDRSIDNVDQWSHL